MAKPLKQVWLYVEGKSDETFFEGSKFRDFTSSLGYTVKVKNLRTKGNVLSNFEKFLKLHDENIHASILVYDKDCSDFNSKKIESILKNYNNSFLYVAIQELEAWFCADHEEVKRINHHATLNKDTHSITNPKNWLKDLFFKADKGFKNEMSFAEHFAEKINLTNARQHNKSLDRFLSAFENNFKEK